MGYMDHDEAFRRYDGEKTSYRWRDGKITTGRNHPNGIWYLVGQSRRLTRVQLARLSARMERQAVRAAARSASARTWSARKK